MELLFIILAVGFIAELIDGTFGMAFGVTANSFLLSIGLAPAIASATVHQAEVFTTLTSGISHLKVGNVDGKLFRSLVIPGCIGGALGAYILSSLTVKYLSTAVSIYLILMGLAIIARAFGKKVFSMIVDPRILGAIGGLLDAIGGGGWGPVVTSTLIANGRDPKKSIGSVNLAEFFVTVTEAIAFILFLGFSNLHYVVPFLVGGIIAAPVGAWLCKRLPTERLLVLVGLLVIAINIKKISGI